MRLRRLYLIKLDHSELSGVKASRQCAAYIAREELGESKSLLITRNLVDTVIHNSEFSLSFVFIYDT